MGGELKTFKCLKMCSDQGHVEHPQLVPNVLFTKLGLQVQECVGSVEPDGVRSFGLGPRELDAH